MKFKAFKGKGIANRIADAITVSRILFAVIFVLCLIYTNKFPFWHVWAIASFTIIMLSDCLDGAIVKRWGIPTVWGSLLDPLADKICIDISFIVITIKYDFPVWPAIILVSRDILVLGAWCLFLLKTKKPFLAVPHIFGKIMVLSQMLTILFVVLRLPQGIIRCAWQISILFSLVSLLIYTVHLEKYRKLIN